ncbi:MAG: hypothetical protein MK357_03000 [SAR202 cluster bacterium]|nr:hypothetical protein [SAR202 cluster bacterium]
MITGIIPQTGRQCYAALNKFSQLTNNDFTHAINILNQSKSISTSSLNEAHKKLSGISENQNIFTLRPDRKRSDRPYRIAFLGMDMNLNGINVRIEGDEPHNCSSLIRLSLAHFAIVGFDELLVMMGTYLNPHKRNLKDWNLFNDSIGYQDENHTTSTDIRIAGSAELMNSSGLQDFVGLFPISANPFTMDQITEKLNTKSKVFINGRYEGIISNYYEQIIPEPVSNVEDAVMNEQGTIGFEIVQTGKTINSKNLFIFGKPAYISESLLIYDFGKYQNESDLQKVISKISPEKYNAVGRVSNLRKWYKHLSENLSNQWIGKPNIDYFLPG